MPQSKVAENRKGWEAELIMHLGAEPFTDVNADEVMALLSQRGAREAVRSGLFGGPVPVASYIASPDSGALVHRIASERPDGITLDDCDRSLCNGGETLLLVPIHRKAIHGGYSSALAAALELQPDHPFLRESHDDWGATPHGFAWRYIASPDVRANVGLNEEAREERLRRIDCARMLLRAGAPLRHPKSDFSLEERVFAWPWAPLVHNEIADLLREYHRAGLLDVDSVIEQHGRPPLHEAIRGGNAHAAALAVELGCQVPDDLEDIIATTKGDATELHAAITQALMARQIRCEAAQQSDAPRASRAPSL